MSVFRSIEHGIQSVLEGAFGRAFRSHVQPVELARKLAKEMDDHRTVSVSRVYAPNEYELWLSPDDREQFRSYEGSLLTELSDYLSEHARREGYALLSTPKVTLQEDEDLAVGEFGIATRLVQQRPKSAEQAAPPPPAAPPNAGPSAVPPPAPAMEQANAVGETKIFKAPSPETEAVTPEEAERLGLAHEPPVLRVNGRPVPVAKRSLVVGRSRECDVTLDDPNVSRRHAEIRQEHGGFWIVDLNSTNGVEVNGARVDRKQLEDGDEIVVGKTNLTFERNL